MALNELKFMDGVKTGLPVFIGYLPMAMTFGLLAKAGGISLMPTAAFSVMVFAGASQFMALNLLKAGVLNGEIILATFLLNSRHLLMSASMATRLQRVPKSWLFLAAFGITDETFSVVTTQQLRPNLPFLLGLEGISYSAWVGGTLLGFLIGSTLPSSVQASMGIALYAMFVAILMPQFRKSQQVIFLAAGAGLIHTWLVYQKILPAGWDLICAMLITTVLGAFFFKDIEEVIT